MAESAALSAPAPAPTSTPTTTDVNQWAMFTHLSALAGLILPLGNILGPLVLWLMKREEDTVLDQHGKAALNFQITVSIAAAVLFVVGFVTLLIMIGFLFLFIGFLVGLFGLVMAVIAGIKAGNGEAFEYPMAIQFLK